MMAFARTDRSLLGQWWWTVDRWSLTCVATLACAGAILSFAASPAVAERLGYESLHFVYRQLAFLGPAAVVLLVSSMLSPRGVRRLSLVVALASLLFMIAALFVGIEVKGARRWLAIGPLTFQPSEFMKPAFIVLTAWILSRSPQVSKVTGYGAAFLLYGVVIALLLMEPDFGQALLISFVWAIMVFVAGMPWVWMGLMGLAGIGGIIAAYSFVPHVTSRIDRFLNPGSGDTYQVDRAREAIIHGGLGGVGPGDGVVKKILPDAHTDFAFSVAAEEYGFFVALALILLFAFVVIRGLMRAVSDGNPFVQLAATGLFLLFGFQAFINIAVNLVMIPSKGMTLPFISYGGSSLVALALTMGFAFALTRRRAGGRLERER